MVVHQYNVANDALHAHSMLFQILGEASNFKLASPYCWLHVRLSYWPLNLSDRALESHMTTSFTWLASSLACAEYAAYQMITFNIPGQLNCMLDSLFRPKLTNYWQWKCIHICSRPRLYIDYQRAVMIYNLAEAYVQETVANWVSAS
jgi:hypothetical protein